MKNYIVTVHIKNGFITLMLHNIQYVTMLHCYKSDFRSETIKKIDQSRELDILSPMNVLLLNTYSFYIFNL